MLKSFFLFCCKIFYKAVPHPDCQAPGFHKVLYQHLNIPLGTEDLDSSVQVNA